MSSKILISIISALAIVSLSAGISAADKPRPPLHVSIVPVEEGIAPANIQPGDVLTFRITVNPLMDAQEMRIRMELAGGAKLISGETSWTGPVTKNAERDFLITVQAPQKGRGKIRVHVVIPSPQGTSFGAEAVYDLGPGPKPNAGPEKPAKKDSRGRAIIEYQAQ
jgi:hypothetical protein